MTIHEIISVDCAPTLIVCRGGTVQNIQAALYAGWEYRGGGGVPLQLGVFRHPDGVEVPIYQNGKDFSKLAKPTDVVVVEGDVVPPWALACTGVVTVATRPGGVLLTVHKVYAETGQLRAWIQQIKTLPAEASN